MEVFYYLPALIDQELVEYNQRIMSEKPQVNAFETNKAIDDNARKFISDPINRSFLQDHHAKSFTLTTDWLETSDESEKKLPTKNMTMVIFKSY
jgi:hypothetical protein